MLMGCEKLHDRLQEYYNYEILMCIHFQYNRVVYTRVGTDKKCIINGKTFNRYPLELIFTVIVVKGWLLS